MSSTFWSNKPVNITTNVDSNKYILSHEQLLEKIDNEIYNFKFKINYKVIDSDGLNTTKIDEILHFINHNYVTSSDNIFKFVYTPELFRFYIHDSIIFEFYSSTYKNIIGYIIGKPSNLNIEGENKSSVEVNFLCVASHLRKIGLSSFMINVLTKEIILQYKIYMAHYTTGTDLPIPHFCKKQMYHRLINIPVLHKNKFFENIDQDLLVQKFNCFNYNTHLKNVYTIKYSCGCNDNSTVISQKVIKELYNNYIAYSQKTYHVYECVSLDEFSRTFSNSAFHHFLLYKGQSVVSYICLFRLDTYNSQTDSNYSSGFYYYMFFDDSEYICTYLELIHEYIYLHKIFDVITFSDIFDIDYNQIKCIKGTGELKYYFYNLKYKQIKSYKNGLVTI